MSSTRVTAAVIAVVFALFAVIQINDEDPLPWILLYGVTATFAVLKMFVRRRSVWCLVVASIALLWALSLVPAILDESRFTGTELEREFLGLVLVAVAMWIVQGLPDSERNSSKSSI